MKYRRILAPFTITLLTAILTTGTLTAINFADQSGISAQKQSKEVFVDSFLQEASSTKQTGVSERLIVMFNPALSEELRKNLLSTIEGVEIIQAYKIISGVCITAPLGAIESIKKLREVEAIWLDHKVEALKSSNQNVLGHGVSPMLSDSAGLINAPSLWALGINGSGIVIAVVDTGINWLHESLDDLDDDPATVDPKVIANVSFVPGVTTGFDDHGHGTHVAGIAAGTGGPSHTYMGVAPGAQLYAVKVLDSTGSGQWSWVVAGIEWSVKNGADVITMSLGGWGYPYDPVSMASDAAVDAGIVVTVAAGNDPYYGGILSPGLATKVITVGATTKDDAIASFSSKGPNTYDYRGDPDVVAPGVGIMSADAWNTTGYVSMSGTSMATPHVAGGAALLLQAFANATPNLVASALMASAVDTGYDSYTQGAGRIDVLGAYDLVGTVFSAVLPCELEVYTYTGFGPFANYSTAWVNLTIVTPASMPDVEIRLTGNLSEVISFVDSPSIGDVEGWAYFTFEVYASGVPNTTYSGFIEILSAGLVVNKLPITVSVKWNPVPKINSVFFNATSVLRVTETLGVTINATDLDGFGALTPPSNLTVNVYILYNDIEWYIEEGPISIAYNDITGLYEFNYTFPADFSLGIFGIGVEAFDPQEDMVRAMVRTFYVENNIPVISVAVSPRNVAGNEIVSINVTASDIETQIGQLQITATMITPIEEKIPVQLMLENGMFTASFNDTSEDGVYLFSAMVTDRDGASSLSVGFFEVDNTLPSIEILSPLDGAVVSGIVNVTCITWDAKLENASIIIHEDLVKNWTVSGLQTYAWNTTRLDDGSYTVKLAAQDEAGNTFEKVVAVVVDNTAPEVSITNPEGGDELTGTVTILFNASDDHLSSVLLYIGSTTYSVTGETSYEWNTTTVVDGTYTIKLIAYDKAGNKAETPPIKVTVTNLQKIIEERYEEGYREGYDEGSDRGREEGYEEGHEAGEEEGYASGIKLGVAVGALIGSVITTITAIIAYAILKRRKEKPLAKS
ncbi:MAG: S8 family serine peptidase [Candidatus Bathyarchaeaceae archaeon]